MVLKIVFIVQYRILSTYECTASFQCYLTYQSNPTTSMHFNQCQSIYMRKIVSDWWGGVTANSSFWG